MKGLGSAAAFWPGSRRPTMAILALLVVVAFFSLLNEGHRVSVTDMSIGNPFGCDADPPADWDKLYKWEDQLPQHDINMPAPEGQQGRYVLFMNQIQMLGWNNQLNEVLMNSWLAYKSNRTYVFHDYIWKAEYYPWRNHRNKPSVPRTPLNALISGPSAGGSWESGDNSPRAISLRFFDQVCPKHERRIINTRDVKPVIGSNWIPGDEVFKAWQNILLEAPERCIEIQPADRSEDSFPQTFDLWFWGNTRALDMWEDFKASPVSRLLATSPIVQSAVDRNTYLFQPRGSPRSVPKGASMDPWDRTLAVHIRRGDFKEACQRLAQYNSTFYSWNLHTFLPDKFTHPPGWDVNRETTIETYIRHCYPEEDSIVEKIHQSREDYVKAGDARYLDTIFILTNDRSEFLTHLKRRLLLDGWNNVVTTMDLELDQQQKDVGMAVDMDMARKAAVFVGNGWSSFTSNIVHRRLVDGKEPISIRFF